MPKFTPFAVAAGLVVLVVVAVLVGLEWWRREYRLPPGVNCAALERLVVRDAPSAATQDAKRGAAHLVGVQGYTIELPGVRKDRGDWLPSNYRVQVLPCTSDAITSRRHGALNDKARAYASAYNQTTLSMAGAPRPQYRPEPQH